MSEPFVPAPHDFTVDAESQQIVAPTQPVEDMPPAAEMDPTLQDNPFAKELDERRKANEPTKPSLIDRFVSNANESAVSGTIMGSGELADYSRQMQDPSLTQPQRDAAASIFHTMMENRATYEAMKPYSGPLEGLFALGGQFVGGMSSPEALIFRVPGMGAIAKTLLGKFGAAAVRVGETALSQGVVNIATDPIVQANNIRAGAQANYSFTQTALSFPLGVALGGGIAATHEAVRALIREARPSNPAREDLPPEVEQGRVQAASEDPALRGGGDEAAIKGAELPAKPIEIPEALPKAAPTRPILTLEAVKDRQRGLTFNEIYARSEAFQPELGQAAREIAAAVPGVDPIIPSVKDRQAALEKISRKGYADAPDAGDHGGAHHLTDISRVGFVVDTPDQMRAVVDHLSERYDVLNEGFRVTDLGYGDTKLLVQSPNGIVAEVQVLPRAMADAKKGDHSLYRQWREAAPGDERDALLKAQQDHYSAALSDGVDAWRSAADGTGTPGNRAPNSDGVRMRPDRTASSTEYGNQPLEPRNTQAASDLGDKTTGLPSSLSSFTGDTSSGNITDGLKFRKRSPQEAAGGEGGANTTAKTATSPASGKSEAKLLSPQEQAIKIADDLDAVLRQGRVQGGKDVQGHYDTRQDVTRIRSITDLPTVFHESAHQIEANVGKELTALIEKHAAELTLLDYDPTLARAGEGFAEWLRMSIENPAAGKGMAPAFTSEFEALMGRSSPDILAAINDAKSAYAAWLNAQSGAKVDAIVKRQEPDGILKTLKKEGVAKTIGMVLSKAYQGIFDDKAPVTKAVRDLARMVRDASGEIPKLEGSANPELQVRMFARSHQAAVRDMMDGVRGYREVAPSGPSLRDAIMKATGKPSVFGTWDDAGVKEFSNYAVLRRADVLYEKFDAGELPNRPLAMTRADVREALAAAEAENPNLHAAGDMLHDYTRALLKKGFDAGQYDRETFDALMREKFYVPFYRDMSDKPMAPRKPTAGASSSEGPGKAELIKRIQGSDRDIIDPIQSIMTQTFLLNRTIAHNDIIRSFVDLARSAQKAGAAGTGRIVEEIPAHQIVGKRFDLAENVSAAARQNGISDMDTKVLLGALTDTFGEDPIMGSIFHQEPTSPRGEPIVFYKEGGALRAARFISRDEGMGLYEALTDMPTEMRDVAIQIGATSATLMRSGIVTNPVFALTNFIRDQIAVGILRPDIVPFNPRGLGRELAQDNIAKMYTYAGGVSPGAGAAELSNLVNRDIDALARKGWVVQKLGGLHDLVAHGDILAGAKAVGEVVEVSEAGTRLNVMKTVYDQKVKQGLSQYDAMLEAAYQATDLMDFGRHGSGTAFIRKLVPFLNAHLQGLDKARRTMIQPLMRALTGDVVTEAEQAAVKNAGLALFKMIGVGGGLGYAYSLWASQHDAYRDANDQLRATHLVIPGSAFGYPGKVLVVPKPFELAMGFNLGEMIGLGTQTGDPRAASFAIAGVQEVMQPPNVLESIPIVKTWAELKLNRSFFTGRDIVPQRLQGLAPFEQYTEKTSNLAKQIGRALNIPPVKVDYAIGNTFGLWGRDLLAVSNTADPNSPSAALDDAMFFRRFIKSADSASETTKRFWELAAATNGQFAQAKNTYEDMLGKFRDADAQRFLSALPAEQRAYVTLNSAADDNGKAKFSADDKRLNPLARSAEAVRTINGMIRELTSNSQKSYEDGGQIQMDPQKRRQVIDNLRVLAAMEQRNALVIMNDSGYQGRPLLSTGDQFKSLAAIDKRAADELATRYATAKVYTTAAVAKAWPIASKRLINDGGEAEISDLAFDAKADGPEFGGERVRKPQKRRVEIAPSLPFAP